MKPDQKKIKKMEEEDKYVMDENTLKKKDKKFKTLAQRLSKLIVKKSIKTPVLKRIQAKKKKQIKALKKRR